MIDNKWKISFTGKEQHHRILEMKYYHINEAASKEKIKQN